MSVCPKCREELARSLRAAVDVLDGPATKFERTVAASVASEAAALLGGDARHEKPFLDVVKD
jgi:hypothetical protein